MRLDVLSLIGLFLGVGAILLGQFFEGGHVSSLINGPAMLIVFGGTLGAIMLQSPITSFVRGIKLMAWVFMPPKLMADEAIEKIITWSNIARKEGLLGLEAASETEDDDFARKGLQLLVDGNEPEVMRSILEVEVDTREQYDMGAAKLYESMGGYTPTIGIIGAVLGLIQVMENLSDPSRLGHGIAVAFVATIYGVGLANLILLPIANKLKSIVLAQSQFRYMVIEGIVSIAEGDNPRNIESKLQGFLT
ncbi:MAG: flagellar motor protein [Chromatiales bacterium]|nr:flagellar motor protein [Gammaproteobacteria bacterium]MBW6476295.1 flagellar motor protein [Chromatiales bacterium]